MTKRVWTFLIGILLGVVILTTPLFALERLISLPLPPLRPGTYAEAMPSAPWAQREMRRSCAFAHSPTVRFPSPTRLSGNFASLALKKHASVVFHSIHASDNTYWIKIPSGWSVKVATIEQFVTQSPNQEGVFRRSVQLFADQASLDRSLAGLKFLQERGFTIPPEVLSAYSRLMSPPLSPVDVVAVLIPKMSPDLIHNMQIIESEALPSSTGSTDTQKQRVVHYRYTNLETGKPVLKEGFVSVSTTPVTSSPIMNSWWFFINGFEAPPKLLRKGLPLYQKVLSSLKLDYEGLQQWFSQRSQMASQIGKIGNSYIQGAQDLRRSMEKSNEAIGNVFKKAGELPKSNDDDNWKQNHDDENDEK